MTAPASATGVGAVLPAVGVGAAVVGTVAVGHGAYVAGNTLNNIFSKNNDGHPDTDNSAQGAQDQAEEINKNQAEQRKVGQGNSMNSVEKSNQRANNSLKKIKNLKDAEVEFGDP